MAETKVGALALLWLTLAADVAAQDFEARVEWQQRLELGTLVSGVVREVRILPGQRVAAGEVLVELDRREFESALRSARAQVAGAEAHVAEAEREAQRTRDLFDQDLIAEHELQLANIALAEQRAELAQAVGQRQAAELELERATLLAPFPALVLAVPAIPGQAINNRLAVTPLVILARAEPLVAVARIDETQAAELKPGREVQVAVRGQWFSGTVLGIALEPIEQRYPMQVGFSAPGLELRQGEGVVIRVPEQ